MERRVDRNFEKVGKLGDDTWDEEAAQLTPAERIKCMWPLVMDSWACRGVDVSELRLQRQVESVTWLGANPPKDEN